MANAFLLKPLPATGIAVYSTVQGGQQAYTLNDYAGVTLQLACDNGSTALMFYDLGADTLIDTVMVFGVGLFPAAGSFVISYATTAQGPFTGSFTGEGGVPFAGSAAMSSGKGVSLWLGAAPVTARYVALNYTAPGAGYAVRLSRVVIGRRFQPQRNFSFGAGFGVRDLGSLDFSRRGVLLRTRGAHLRTTAISFSSLRKDEVEATVKPLLEYLGNTEMVALVTDPVADAQRQNRCYFGPLVGDLGVTWRNAAAWENKANLVSIF